MATTARVGIDIVGTDKTRAAFASAQGGLAAFNRSLNQIKITMAGLAGGNLLAGFTRSMVGINREVPAVKQALDTLTGAWGLFGRKVGDAGLNQALINFANRMSGMIVNTDGLSNSIGAFMGGAVNVMAGVFEGVGRSIAFVYDNMAAFGRLLAAIAIYKFSVQVIQLAFSFMRFFAAIGAVAKGMIVFQSIQRAGLAGFIVLAGVIGYATDSLDDMRAMIDKVWTKVKEVFPEIGGFAKNMLGDLGLDMSAFTTALNTDIKTLVGEGKVMPPVTENLGKLGKAAKDAATDIQSTSFYIMDFTDTMKPMNDNLQQIGQTFSSGLSQAFDSIIDGSKSAKDAFADMAKSMLNSVANMAMNSFLSNIFGGGATGGGGIFAAMFGGAKASGGPVTAGKAYMVGEQGPEMIIPGSSGTVIPNHKLGGAANVNIQIIDQRQNAPPVERQTDAKGNVRLLIRDEVNSLIGSGAADKTMGGRFGARPMKARR